MSIEVATKPERKSIDSEAPAGQTRRRGRQIGTRPGLSMLARGEPMLWVTGGSLALAVLMILGLLLLVIFAGMSTFWPLTLVQIDTLDGNSYLGEITRQEHYDLKYDRIAALSDQQVPAALDMLNPLLHEEIQRLLDSGRVEAELASIRESLNDAIMRDVALDSQVRNAPRSARNRVTRAVETALERQANDFAAKLEEQLAKALAADTSGTAIYALWTKLKEVEPVWVAESAGQESAESWDAEQWSLDQAWMRKALELLTRDVKIPMRRRLFRTENFELTGTHFHWISDFEITSDEDRPEWALTIERLAGGRFYGTPEQFVLRSPRTIPAVEQQLHSILQFFQANQWRLKDPSDQQALAAVIEEVKQEYLTTRQRNVQHFLGLWKPDNDRLLQAVDQQGETVPFAETTPDQAIVEMQEVWADPEAAWEQYTHRHESVRQRYAEQVRIDEVDRGRIGDRINDARLGLRRVELDHEVLVEDYAREMYQLNLELAALEESQRATADLVIQIREHLGDDAAGTALADRFLVSLQEENRQQAAKPIQRKAELQDRVDETPEEARAAVASYLEVRRQANLDDAGFAAEVDKLKQENSRYQIRMITAQQQSVAIPLNEIVRAYPANRLDGAGKLAIYGSRWREFLMDKPREANSEGGVFPAIWGTIAMTLIMSLVVVPFGVLAALYLREYAKSGPIVSAVRISINNLAGVPSIVFGVFGLGFFCYMVGAYVDGGPENAKLPVWPAARWFAALGVLAVVALAAFVLSLFSLGAGRSAATGLKRYVGYAAVMTWLLATGLVVVVLGTTPYFNGWFETNLPNPKFGQGGMLWSSLTLALLTLPVVIVATEEALSAVPNSLREGSYACGAGKWQTIRRVVLPHAMPGIMTGMILAMARGAGEVAPLMLVGAVKMAPNLPVDTVFPFVHADRSFMHLGFHIYDLGFQSQNSEAAKPMVFTTTLLLIVIIAVLNLAAVGLRARLKKRFFSSAF